MTTQPLTRMPVHLVGSEHPQVTDRLLIVTDPKHGDLTIRWRWTPPPGEQRSIQPDRDHHAPLWRCPVDGKQQTARCPHAFTAALHLAEHLLGLTAAVPTFDERTPE